MCGRFSLYSTEKIKSRYGINDKLSFEPNYSVSPGNYCPVVSISSPQTFSLMLWGLIPSWGKGKIRLINLRGDTFSKNRYFQDLLLTNRCLIPADGFFEWKKEQKGNSIAKSPYYFQLKSRSLFSFAGIYETTKDARGKTVFTHAIITTRPNFIVEKVHDRMPVILSIKEEKEWLNRKTQNFEKFLDPFPPAQMEGWPVSKLINKAEENNPELIKPLFTLRSGENQPDLTRKGRNPARF